MKSIKLRAVLLGASVAAAIGAGPTASAAGSPAILNSSVSEAQVTMRGEVSMRELAASAANLNALSAHANAPEIEQPQHRLPNGRLTSEWRHASSSSTANSSVVALSHGATSVIGATGFEGVHEGDNVTANGYELEPPDQGLAVNANVATEIVNNTLRYFDAATGAPLSAPIATSTLFALDPTIYNLSDPQVFFDTSTQRWFLTEVVYNAKVNAFAIAVSKTSDPLGSYYTYLVDAYSRKLSGCGSVDCFPDYPKDGFNADAFFITADLFSNVSGNFVEAAIYAFPKASLEAGQTFKYLRFDDPNDFVLQPSVPAFGEPFSTAREGSEFFMSAPTADFGTTAPTVSVVAVVDTKFIVSHPAAVHALFTSVATKSYGNGTVPSTEPNVVGPYCASVGVTSAPTLDGGYSTFQSTIQKANGNLYGALVQGATDSKGFSRNIIDYFEIKPTLTSTSFSASVVTQGSLIPPDGYSVSYPAFGLLKSGAGIMGFTITNPDASVVGGYPSAAVIQFNGSTPTGQILVSGQGATSDDGFTGCPGPGPGMVGRWGDYGAATVDATTGYFYTANEMIPDPTVFTPGTYANWGTFITQFH